MMSSMTDPLLRATLRVLSPAGASGRLTILIFHRVLAQPDPLFPDDPDVHRFDALCRWMSSWFRVIPLDVAAQHLVDGTLPARAACITFDDGYADNHDLALPILVRHGLTATFFIATGFLDGGRMWNDTVVEAVRGCLRDRLDITALGLPGAPVLDLSSEAARRQALHDVLGRIKYLPLVRRQDRADAFAALTGVRLPEGLMMRRDQVRAMAAAGMQIGAHTVSHPILATLDDAAAANEVAKSRHELERIVQRDVRLFAYPNGKPGEDYLPRDVETVRRLGFLAAVSTSPGAASGRRPAMHELPRFTPWDRSRLRFGTRLVRNLAAG